MLTLSNLGISFNGNYLFRNINLMVQPRDRVGLAGRNGAGKTTLMRITAGQLEPEEGNVILPSAARVGYLPQELSFTSALTVKEEAMRAFEDLNGMRQREEELHHRMMTHGDPHSREYERILIELHETGERLLLLGANSAEGQLEKILMGLGFKRTDLDRKLAEFSGGWRMRVEIAKLLLSNPDVLLLDEPTNHLDIESISWLEDYIQNYQGAVILVSHDRRFLDSVTTRTVEIANGKIYDFPMSYSDYVEQRMELIELQQAAYNNQQQKIADIERFIERFRYKATKAKQVQSRIKLLDKMERIEVDTVDTGSIHFKFPEAPQSGRVVVETENAGKSYGSHTVFSNADILVERGNCVAFVGRNGEGKTTMARIISEGLEHTGKCRLGHNVKIGYYAQNQGELLDADKTVFQTLDDIAVGEIRPKIRAILGSFLFSGEDIDKKVKVLSGGEKSRLSIAKLLLSPTNLLILDEPTNHLDMLSKDILKNALLEFSGTIVLVSHDRDFMQGLTDKLYEFRDGKVKEHLGDINEFLAKRRKDDFHLLYARERQQPANLDAGQSSANKEDYLRRKEKEKEQRRIENRITKVEEQISRLEAEIGGIDRMLSEPEKYADRLLDGAIYAQYDELREQLGRAIAEWEQLHEELEDL